MKNKILAISAVVLLASGIAFGFSRYNNGQCCEQKAAACDEKACPGGVCPPHCCTSDAK